MIRLKEILEDNESEFDKRSIYDDLLDVVGEIMGDYGAFEANMRSSASVGEGVIQIKKAIQDFSEAKFVDENDLYKKLYKDLILNYEYEYGDGEYESEADEQEDEEEHNLVARQGAMLNAAALGMSYIAYIKKYGDSHEDYNNVRDYESWLGKAKQFALNKSKKK
jgi:hypothetical protein